MKHIRITLLYIAVLLIGFSNLSVIPAQAAQVGVLYVKTGGTSTTCMTWDDACDLQQALSIASTGSEVWVAAGTYKPTTSTDRNATFALESGVEIYGGFPAAGGNWDSRDPEANLTILSGDIDNNDSQTPIVTDIHTVTGNTLNSRHVVTGNGVDTTAVLDGFTITAGYAIGTQQECYGGGMLNTNGSSPTLHDLVFTGNYAFGNGGGMYNEIASNPEMDDILFSNNNGNNGAGMSNSYSNPVLSNVTFTAHSGMYAGGGMSNFGSNPTLTDVIFRDNHVILDGGGMYNSGSNPVLTRVTFDNNSAIWTGFDGGDGGAIYNAGSSPILQDVTITNNTSSDYGGGISNRFSSNPVLTDVTLSGNVANRLHGGGIYNDASSPVLLRVTLSGNTATNGSGGGIYNYKSNTTLTDVTIDDNTAQDYGGGIFNAGSYSEPSNPVLNRVTISNNETIGVGTYPLPENVGDGGGMYNDEWCAPSLTNVIFSGNRAIRDGGGMYTNQASTPVLFNVLFVGNYADSDGGGIYSISASPVLTNITFSANTANSDRGGGMYTYNGAVSITNATFSGNSANPYYSSGGGLFNGGNFAVTVKNSVFWANSPNQIAAAATTNVTYSTVQDGFTGEGNLSTDPVLGSLADNGGFSMTHALMAGSPAIDSGNPDIAACPAIDQRGYIRPADGDADGTARCDMGAYEAGSRLPVITLSTAGDGSILADPDQEYYNYGDEVTLTADPADGWNFSGWDGDASGTDSPLTVTVTGDLSITAIFVQGDPEIHYVKQDGVGNCGSWAQACRLPVALMLANSGDQVWVAEGTYLPTTSFDRALSFSLKSGVALYGGFPAAGGEWASRDPQVYHSILSGNIGESGTQADNSYHVVTADGVGSTAILDGFTINGGNANGAIPDNNGGGLYLESSSPTLTNLVISGNSSEFGGGMYANAGTPDVSNVEFTGNYAVSFGGGLYLESSNAVIQMALFRDNEAQFYGGGIHNNLSSPLLENVTISTNTSAYGGGMTNVNQSNPSLLNVTITGNTTADYTGTEGGGAMYNQYSCTPVIRNSIIWGNDSVQIKNTDIDYHAEIYYSIVQGGCPASSECEDLLSVDPLLGSLADNGGFTQTYALGAGSPAVEAGDPDPAFCPATDQRGVPRPLDGDGDGTPLCDIGAYEASGKPVITSLSPTSKQAGSSQFTLTVNGIEFNDTLKVYWNGTELPTTYVNGSQVTATVTAPLVAAADIAEITVGTASAQLFYVYSFADVPPTHTLWRYVEGFFARGITTGCAVNPLRYCPDRGVTRAETAVFILRAINADDLPYTPSPAVTGIFADVPVRGKEWMKPWIEEFYELGITTGCASAPMKYCPERGVTRAEMAVFLLRAKYGTSYIPEDVEPDVFIDLPAAGKDWMEPWIEQFYKLGYTTGCGGTVEGIDLKYCPERGADRVEMATFISRIFGFPEKPDLP